MEQYFFVALHIYWDLLCRKKGSFNIWILVHENRAHCGVLQQHVCVVFVSKINDLMKLTVQLLMLSILGDSKQWVAICSEEFKVWSHCSNVLQWCCSLCFCLKTVVIKAETAPNTVYVFACNKIKVFWVNVKKDLSKTRTGSWAVFHITFFSALIWFSTLLNNVSPCHRWGSKIQLKAVRLLKTSSVSI